MVHGEQLCQNMPWKLRVVELEILPSREPQEQTGSSATNTAKSETPLEVLRALK